MSIIEKAVDKLTNPGRTESPKRRTSIDTAVSGGGNDRIADADKPSAKQQPSAPVIAQLDQGETCPPDPASGDQVEGVFKPTKGSSTVKRTVARGVTVDLEALANGDVSISDSATDLLAEQIRMIKRPLLMNASVVSAPERERSNILMITSSVPNEGKTFVALNLATSIAMDVDRKVLLVDADPMKASLSRRLGIQVRAGLTDLLRRDESHLEDTVVGTSIPDLTVLPCGPRDANLTELLGSERMGALADEMSEQYRNGIVIVDCPPLLAVSGSSALAPLMGQILVVVEAQKTGEAELEGALKQLEKCHSVALVFNKVHKKSPEEFQYRYYDYYVQQKSTRESRAKVLRP